MQVKVLGACCTTCNGTYEAVKKAAEALGGTIEVVQIADVMEILHYGVIQTPAVVIDGKVVCVGKHLNVTQAKQLLNEAENTYHIKR